MKTVEEFRTFILDNYEMLAAFAWGGYKYTRKRGFMLVLVADHESHSVADYVPISDLTEGRVPPNAEHFLTTQTASYDPKKAIVVLAMDDQNCYYCQVDHPDLTPPAAYQTHRAAIDKNVAVYHAGQSPAAQAKLN